MIRAALLAVLLAVASPAAANPPCHTSNATPIITDWTVTPGPGTLTFDANLKARAPDLRPSQIYYAFGGSAWWSVSIELDPSFPTDLSNATVTDSTFHAVLHVEPGDYSYDACVMGDVMSEPELCPCAYQFKGFLIVPAVTPTRRESWGAVRERWAR